MHFAAIGRILGVLLMLFSLSHVPPLLIALYDGGGSSSSFLWAFAITLLTGLFIWLPVRSAHAELRVRDGYLITALFWIVLGTFGAIPFLLSPSPSMASANRCLKHFLG